MGNKRHIKKGDTVYVLSGNERGRSGKVIDVQTASERVVVEGLNTVSYTHLTLPTIYSV